MPRWDVLMKSATLTGDRTSPEERTSIGVCMWFMPAAPTKRSIDGEIDWYNTMRTVTKRNYSAIDAAVMQKQQKCIVVFV